MAALSSSSVIEDSALEGWHVIGSGGFGQIYKARHRCWGCDVAIKLLHYDDGTSSSLLRELDMMYRGCNPYVIHVHGMFKGRPPFPGYSVQLGLVMEFMERGSLASLQNTFQSPLPWPLSVRLTHQVALGINFLHSLSPAVLHLDLKPNNVLLDSSLNAKPLYYEDVRPDMLMGPDYRLGYCYFCLFEHSLHVLKFFGQESGAPNTKKKESPATSISESGPASCEDHLIDLTDFGLAKFYHSVTRGSKKNSEEEGGTISYMPPEAFDLSYTPTRASDIYSYGILLWSIVTGKQPYANALSSIVRFRIPQGDRPSLDEIRCQAAGRAGLTRLMDLMKKCWETRSSQRPNALECTRETEELFKMHKHAISDAVHQVLKKVEGNESDHTQSSQAEGQNGEEIIEQLQNVSITQAPVPSRDQPVNCCNDVPTNRLPVQEMAGGWSPNQKEKVNVKDSALGRLKNVCHVDQAHSSGDCKIKPSSVHPIHSSPPPSTSMNQPTKATKIFQPAFNQRLTPQFQRQHSNPVHRVHIHLSDVTGFQYGNNNSMYIGTTDPLERRRHPTAPSAVPVTPHHTK